MEAQRGEASTVPPEVRKDPGLSPAPGTQGPESFHS